MANSQRERCWFDLEMKLHHGNSEWEEGTDLGDEYYSFSGALDPSVEINCLWTHTQHLPEGTRHCVFK